MTSFKPSEASLVGCAVGVLSFATQSIGLTLQRRSHIEEDEKPLGIPRKPAYQRPMWQFGLLLFILSNVVGSSIHITTLPLILLSPVQAIGLVFNSICSSVLLSEPFTQYAMLGTILVAVGALMVVYFGAVRDPQLDLGELLDLLHRKPFVIWMVCTFLTIGGILYLIRASKKWEPNPKHPERLQLLGGTLYGVICGILSAHSLLMAKAAVEILGKGSGAHWKNSQFYHSWTVVGVFLLLAFSNLYFLNCGLHLCSTSVIYPLIFCIFNIATIINDLIYSQKSSQLTGLHFFMIASGTLLLLIGVVCLSWRLGLNDDMGLHQHLLRRPYVNDLEPFRTNSYVPNPNSSPTLQGIQDASNSLFSIMNTKPEYTSFRNLTVPALNTNLHRGLQEPIREVPGSYRGQDETILSRVRETSPMLSSFGNTSYDSFVSSQVEPPIEQTPGGGFEPVSPFTAASKNKYKFRNSPYR